MILRSYPLAGVAPCALSTKARSGAHAGPQDQSVPATPPIAAGGRTRRQAAQRNRPLTQSVRLTLIRVGELTDAMAG
jgi:hypothetical protein